MAVARKIGIVCLVTRVCLTTAILTAKASSDPSRSTATSVARPRHSYLPAASTPLPKHARYTVHVDRAIERQPSSVVSPTDYSRIQLAPSSNGRIQKSQTGPRRFPAEIHRDDVWLSAKVPNASPSPPPVPTTTTTTTTMTTTTSSESQDDVHRYVHSVPRRLAYQGIEKVDGYLTEELSYDDKLPYPARFESTYRRRGPQDLTTAIKALDRFLSETLNSDSYNSALHPPPNPVLALVLSRYGRYVPGTRNPRVYAYMAVNNIHNHKPFGRYKYECDEEPIYAAR